VAVGKYTWISLVIDDVYPSWSLGSSGPNHEYLFNLCRALLSLAPQVHDPHIFDLETRVQKLLEQSNTQK
jgi:cation transport regulator ChaC